MDRSNPTRSLHTVYHVGDLSGERKRPYLSYEGAGVSVSQHPDIWRNLIRTTGDGEFDAAATTYELTTDGATFYDAIPGGPPRESVIEWAFANDFVQEQDGFEVRWRQNASHIEMPFLDRDRAEREAAVEGRTLHETSLLILDEYGRRYWEHAFQQPLTEANPLVIRDLTPVWYAEAHGFDGVWWDEQLAPATYSAPRGVVFQSRLDEWNISP